MSSNVVLSAAVRQNLLSLQSTAALLATTQTDLATGNKVNSALDDPTSYFTAQGLNTRASNISNLLNGISNGIQVLQAANTGITSLQNLVENAQSVATQALQAPIGYDTKSNYSTTIGGATSSDLRGTTTYSNATAVGNILYTGTAGGTTAATSGATLGATAGTLVSSTGVIASQGGTTDITSSSFLTAAANGLSTNSYAGDSLTVNGHSITFVQAAVPSSTSLPSGDYVAGAGSNVVTDGSGDSTVYLGTSVASSAATVSDLLNAIDLASGAKYIASQTTGTATLAGSGSTVSASGVVTLSGSTGASLSVTGTSDLLHALNLTTATGTGETSLTAPLATSSASLGTPIQAGSTLTVDGHTITFVNENKSTLGAVPTGSGSNGNIVTDGNGDSTVFLQSATVADLLNAVDLATGTQTATIASSTAVLSTATGVPKSSISSGVLTISTGTTADLDITGTGNALSALGLAGNTGTQSAFTAARTSTVGSLAGKTLTFSSFEGGTAVTVTFGDGTNGTVQTLAQLNAALQADNLSASINTTGNLTVSAANDFASSTLGGLAGGVIGGTATTAVTWTIPTAPIADPVSQATRANLVTQYNNILDQINKTAEDSSYNGINLLNGDNLQLVFDETGKSTLNITGTTENANGLGLANLTQGIDFVDNNSTNHILTSLATASTTLQSLASTLGSNLSVVQNRQTFNAGLINVLQTGATNLTIADPNELAAQSQALTTRQSIAVSALALANQNQQSVLQLLR
jgi:flagellin-like hook-associated protein FlgL